MKDDSDKRERILDAAADLFETQPFHKVLLSDVARVAAVGKGTLYLYFPSKEDLYFEVLFRGFDLMLARLREVVADTSLPADRQLRAFVYGLGEHFFRRAANMAIHKVGLACSAHEQWRERIDELLGLAESILRRGIAQGVFRDANPRLTVTYIPGLLHGACHFAPDETDVEKLCGHAYRFILHGLGVE